MNRTEELKKEIIGSIFLILILGTMAYVIYDITAEKQKIEPTCRESCDKLGYEYYTYGGSLVDLKCWCLEEDKKPIQVPFNYIGGSE